MSGPKCSAYSVAPDRNLLLERARADAARASADAARRALDEAINAAKSAGVGFGAIPAHPGAGASASELQRFVAAADRATREVRRQVEERRRLYRLQRLTAANDVAAALECAKREAEAQGVRLDGLDVHAGALPENSGLSDIEHFIESAQRRLDAINRVCERHAALNDMSRVAEAATRLEAVTSAWVDGKAPADSSSQPDHADAFHPSEREDRVAHLLQNLPALAAAQLNEIDALAQEALAASNRARFAALEQQILLVTQRAKDGAARVAAERAVALENLQLLDGLRGGDVETARRALLAFLNGETLWHADLQRAAEAAHKYASRVEDDQFVSLVLKEELKNLGYEVEDDFEVVFARGGTLSIRPPPAIASEDYAIQVAINPERAAIDLNVIRFGAPGDAISADQSLRDREVETRWCADYQRVVERASERGVFIDTLRAEAPGASPLAVVAHARRKASRAPTAAEKKVDG